MGAIKRFFTGESGVNVKARKVNKDAFDIKGADKFRDQANQQFGRSVDRSKFAQNANQGFIKNLQAQASGQAPSIAEAQLRQAQDKTLAQQLASIQAARPRNAANSARNLIRSQALQGQNLAQQAAGARLQEQRGAQQLLGTTLAQEQAAADNLTQGFLQQGFSMAQAQQAAQAQLEALKNQNDMQAKKINAEAQQAVEAQFGKAMAGLAQGAGRAIASDKRVKNNIKDAGKEFDDFVSKIKSKSFKYKEGFEPDMPGEVFGVMAQDLEKSKIGKSMVDEDENGVKTLNLKRGFAALLASQGRTASKISALEKALAQRKKKNGRK